MWFNKSTHLNEPSPEYTETLIESEAQISILQKMRSIGSSKSEKFLLQILKGSTKENVRLAVLETLGSCGSLKSVQYLLPFIEDILPSDEKKVSRNAIYAIQLREGVEEKDSGLILMSGNAEQGSISLPHKGEEVCPLATTNLKSSCEVKISDCH